jgi:hypothetical protein
MQAHLRWARCGACRTRKLLIFVAAVAGTVAVMLWPQAKAARTLQCTYRRNHHQIAKAAVAKMAVRPVERSSENAASLIQSVNVRNFRSA